MKKKFFLFIAALCAATSMWGQMDYSWLAISYQEYLDAPQYMQNIAYNDATQTLSFTDNYRNDMAFLRRYYLSVSYRTQYSDVCARYSMILQRYVFDYGEWLKNEETGGWDFHDYTISSANSIAVYGLEEETTGGQVAFNISKVITACMAAGHTAIHISIEGLYFDPVSQNYFYYETAEKEYNYGYSEKNQIDIDLPSVRTFDLSSPSGTVKYGEHIELNCTVQAAGQARLVFSESDQQGGDQRLIKDYTLSAEEAANGKTVTYSKLFIDDDVPATKYYNVALYLSDGKAGEQSTSLNFRYPLVIDNGAPEYHAAGDVISLPKSTCGDYTVRTVNNLPVQLEDLGSAYRLTMPACQVWLKENTKQYTVQFRDYDNTIIKTEKVACGNDATPPSDPVHAGMTFTGWDKSCTNIQGSQVIHALYSVDGVQALLSMADHSFFAIQGETNTFNIYVKTSSAVTARAWLQSAWLDDENDALVFGDLSGYTDFTADQAAMGSAKMRDEKILPTGALHFGHRARYFRLRVRVQNSSNDIYSNIVRLDTYYPLTINSRVEDLNAYVALSDGQTCFHNVENRIYARPLDTIHVLDYKALACGMTFQLFPNPDGGMEAGDYWAVVPQGYGEGTLTIAREKHTVLFYCEGLGNSYYSLIYGEGAYEPQEIECGNAATPPDISDELSGRLFRGWKARGEYADDAYNNVIQDMAFDAILEDQPQRIDLIPVPQQKARKYLVNGAIYIALPDGQVYNINGIRVR